MEDLVVKDKIDVLYDRQMTHRRRRIEWPSENPQFLSTLARAQMPLDPSPQSMQEAIDLLELEESKCSPNSGYPPDIGIFDNFLTKTPKYISDRLVALYYRGRIQSAILDTFIMLIQRGLITIDSLRKPFSHGSCSDTVETITCLLRTFEGIAIEDKFSFDCKEPHPLWDIDTTYEAVDWLSTMIARGCADVAKLFETIEVSGFLGVRNDAAFQRYQQLFPNKKFSCNPNEAAATDGQLIVPYFGSWLPHGLGNKSESEIYMEITNCIKRFDNIERVYKLFYDIPDDILLRADQQAKYLDETDQLPASTQSIS